MLLGLILFMVTSPACVARQLSSTHRARTKQPSSLNASALSYGVDVYDQSSNETRTFAPPGNEDVEIPVPQSKWRCVATKEMNSSTESVSRQILCITPAGVMAAVTCLVYNDEEGNTAMLNISNGLTQNGHVITLNCNR